MEKMSNQKSDSTFVATLASGAKVLCNPFTRIAGMPSLVWGMMFILSSAFMLYCGGYIMDAFVHIGIKPEGVGMWQVVLLSVLQWFVSALLLYVCGVVLSKSKIRIVDIFGTTAFANLLMLPIIAPMLIPPVSTALKSVVAQVSESGMMLAAPHEMMLSVLVPFGIWTLLWAVLFYIWYYKAFAVSCNVRGAKAVVTYIIVIVLFYTFLSSYITKLVVYC